MPAKHNIEVLHLDGTPVKLNDGPITVCNVQNQGTVPLRLVATPADVEPDFDTSGYTLDPGEPIIEIVLADFFRGIDTPVDLHASAKGLYGACLIDHG